MNNRLLALACAFIVAFIGGLTIPAQAANVTVSDEAGLRSALASGDSVTLASDIVVTQKFTAASGYNGAITGNGHTISPNGTAKIFDLSNATITFDSVTLDGSGSARPITANNNSQIKVTGNSVIANGTSANDTHAEGGAVKLTGSSFTLDSSTIKDSKAVFNSVNHSSAGDTKGHGGAIYATGQGSTVTITNSELLNNVSGLGANGGAIYADEGAAVTVTGSTFIGNHTDAIDINGNTGGSIYAGQGKLTVSGSTFNVGKTFNTGGAIRLWSATGDITDTKFIIDNLGDSYGISGGALSSEGSILNVDRSVFTSTGTNKVTHAGGFVTVVEPGEFNLRNSTMIAAGRIATYGGAIAYETGGSITPTATSVIENTKITGTQADTTGGAITISTTYNEAGSYNVTLRNSTISDTKNLYWNEDAHAGGSVMVGSGNTLNVEGGAIRNAVSSKGGLIYNAGNTTISGGRL